MVRDQPSLWPKLETCAKSLGLCAVELAFARGGGNDCSRPKLAVHAPEKPKQQRTLRVRSRRPLFLFGFYCYSHDFKNVHSKASFQPLKMRERAMVL